MANASKSISIPPWPENDRIFLIYNITDNISTERRLLDILDRIPVTRNMPPINSNNPIKKAMSAGRPTLEKNPLELGSNFPIPCTMKRTPTVILNPKCTNSCNLCVLSTASVIFII